MLSVKNVGQIALGQVIHPHGLCLSFSSDLIGRYWRVLSYKVKQYNLHFEQPLLVYAENGLGRERPEVQGDQLQGYVVIQLRDNSILGQGKGCEKKIRQRLTIF